MNLYDVSPNNYRRNCYGWLWIHLTTFVLMTIQAQCKGVTTSCDIPSVFEKQNAILTCSFGMDISTLLRNIKVVHYPSNGKPEKEVIALCHWSKGQATCQTKSGYQHLGNVNGTLLLKILNAGPSNAGGYKCHLINYPLQKEEICNFTVIVPSSTSAITDETISTKRTTFLDTSVTNCDRSDVNLPVIIVAICMGVPLTLETIFILVFILTRLRTHYGKEKCTPKEKKSLT